MFQGVKIITMNILRLFLLSFCLCFYNMAIADDTPRKITFGLAGVTEQDRPFRLGTKVLNEISKKIGHEIELITLPIKRAKLMLENGQIDAELARIGEYADKSISFIKINEPIVKLPFYVYSMRKDIEVNKIKNFEALKVVTIRGQKFSQIYFKNFDLLFVNNIKSGFLFLYKGRADIFVVDGISSSTVMNSLEQEKLGIYRLEPPLAVVNGYTFFNTNNADIAQKFEKALKEIKQEGIYDNIFRETK